MSVIAKGPQKGPVFSDDCLSNLRSTKSGSKGTLYKKYWLKKYFLRTLFIFTMNKKFYGNHLTKFIVKKYLLKAQHKKVLFKRQFNINHFKQESSALVYSLPSASIIFLVVPHFLFFFFFNFAYNISGPTLTIPQTHPHA